MRISLLGAPRLHRGDQAHDLAASDALLLAWLALDGAVPRRRAAEWLWPDRDARRANLSLRQRLFRLKRAAGVDVVVGDATLELAGHVVHDLADFEARLGADAEHGRGELLAGISPSADGEAAQWLVLARERWAERRQRALAERAEALAASQQLAAALRYAERLAAEAPWLEHAQRRVMRLHYLRGDRAAALAAYRRCEQWLARELGARPGTETRALAALLADDAAAAPAESAAAPLPPPLALLRPPRLVGREAALQRIAAAWQAGRHVLVSGEPGIGKSRLLAEQAARAGALVVEARPGDAQLPYGVAARLVQGWLQRAGAPAAAWAAEEWARFAPGLGPPAPGAAATARLQAALAAWAAHAAAAGGAAVIVDDLQFADAASLDALLALLAPAVAPSASPASPASPASTPAPLRWLLAVRAAERPPALQAWLASPAGDGTEELQLAALDAEAVAELLQSLALPDLDAAGWATALWRHAGGNPFYTLQTLLGCAGATGGPPPAALPVPQHLGQLVQRRLQQLGAPALQLAQIAALAEADFSVPLAARLLQRHAVELAPAWSELEAAQVLRGGAFAHDLVREGVAATLPAPIACELHRQIADALAHGDGDRDRDRAVPPARLARHLEQGGQPLRAAAAYVAAADQALAAGLRREEAAMLDAARRGLARGGSRQQRFRVLERRCRAARYVDAYAEQLRLADELSALVDGPLDAADAALSLAAVHAEGQQWAPALSAVEAALGQLPAGEGRRRRRAAALLARCRMGLGDADAAIAAMQAGAGDALAGDDSEAARYLIDLASLLGKADRPREAWPLLQRARAIADAAHDWGLAAEAYMYLGWLHTNWARTRRSVPYYEKARELHARTGAPMSTSVVFFIGLARQYRELGRYAEAQQLMEVILATQGGAGEYPMRTVGLMDLAVLFLELGQPARALQLLGSGREPPADAYAPSWLVPRARIEAWAGRPAADLLQAAFELVRNESQRLLRWVVARDLALSLPADEGEALVRAEAADCAAVDCPSALWSLRIAHCDRLLALGRADEAAALARALLRRFAGGVPPGVYPPRAWLIVHRALAAAGDAPAAAEAHRQGRRWLHDWALPNVPPPYRESFLHRNPFNPAFAQPFDAAR
ncbi:MAG: AAA family ATPase [Proteobacteria bacterium]|nr:AAA family ATPase [Pseudomonadota bacterium]